MALTDKKIYDEKGGFELSDLRNEKLHMVSLQGAELHGVDARDTSLVHVNFVGSKWKHIYFSNVHNDMGIITNNDRDQKYDPASCAA